MKRCRVEPRSYQEIIARGYRRSSDFLVRAGNPENIAQCLLVAPHGGGIEEGTSEILRALAALGGWAYYYFDGILRTGNKEQLHITSTRFDEPDLMRLLPQTKFAVSFHGASGSKERRIYVGGRYDEGRRVLVETLNADLAAHDMQAINAAVGAHHEEIAGKNRQNITNRGRRGEGVQLEFSRGARLALFERLNRAGRRRPKPTLDVLARSIDRALRELTGQHGRVAHSRGAPERP